jgi:phosphoglycerol transferase MdoB-like AlkP superfamily enzyme
MVAVYVVLFCLLWLVLTLLYMLELPGVGIFIHHHGKWLQAALLILQPALSFVMIEIMVSNYNIKMFQSYGIYNIAWYCAVIFLLYVISRSTRLAIIISNLFIYLAGVLNYLVYLFRGNPIIPSDLLAWQTGMSVASNYQVSFSVGFMIATIMMYSIMVIGSKLEEGQAKISFTGRLVGVALYSVYATLIFFLFFHTDIIKKQISVLDFFAPKYTYCTYGTAFGFVANVEAMEAEEPEGYTTDIVQKLLSEAESNPALSESVAVKPNIIAIMNEAFSDPRLFGDYQTNISFLPHIDSLKENTIKGTMYTSVFGGATSDTEYEFLTGNSMAVMPQNCVPYQQFITDSRDSLAATLKAQGYNNIAIHPYAPSGYKRDLVYPLLGFDEFLSKDDFSNPHMIRSYISDRDSYKKIIEQYETKGDQPLFIFNVTMQNHGGYSGERLFDEKDTVRLTQLSGYDKVEQYLSLLRESDKAFQTLVDYFSRVEEPTIILIFGDHQPVVYSELHKLMESNPLMTLTDLDKQRYAVPFIMWANYDITEDDLDSISANYLSSYLLKTAGLPGTAYNEYLLQLQKDLPVINAHFYITKEGECYPLSETTTYTKQLQQYQYVGYNNALDNKNKLWEYYRLRP